MDIFVARQPIFNRKNEVVAYELLFRNGQNNFYNNTNGDEATLKVIANTFYTFDFKDITDNKKAFINFTEELIKKEIATILPKEYVVIEILENIEPNDEIVDACKRLKKRGFILALDDFVFHTKYIKLIEIADIIKIDFKITTGGERKKVFELKKINNKIKFLAEKVENKEEYDEALKLGYSYFQGYYFSKPIVLSRKNIPTNKDTAIKILKLINKDDFDFNKLEELIIKDLGLSYKIIKLINSSAYCLKNEVRSIKYAIALLGRKEIIKWLYVVLLNDLKENNTDELIKVSLQRAKLCELICNMSEYKNNVYSAYMVGLFSVMDAILNCSIEVILKELYIDDEIKEGLIEKDNFLNKILKLAINYEKGQWENVEFYTKEIGVNDNKLAEAYIDAIKWADDVVS
ncbi:EAL and HDOD domain-containing protein [Clostridium beijerinckii]|uniref:EAL and modified HD-GYP domain-containing signal transduction protein n=1 Tax=Clostridium beijerinckii TaxID=1520 RepID=A0A9Q5CTA5_CLOBE|nr:HDOD domain-containing protein [Clostridium beijerinckii]AQS04929.1 EAL domain protein [Clostridium beijerinckii]MBA2885911.1 EAL and modified HD-GYP domain-containing signal transduction protein [Clostridium beijerinckii]MBA2900800.1 EAL and modified HD-GYP domain-containing signal transduction protein [Clostridium beijerinckii]MBA2910470.1 EAL and modified HD-GYP domain-containing signal transduction protein [Clostridium beijerinckii]MBA9015508.1 EAL and modified HD-GYP domain-containing 